VNKVKQEAEMCKIEYEGKKECGWPRCTWPLLDGMYPTILGWDVVVRLPTCVLAEMYPAIPGWPLALLG